MLIINAFTFIRYPGTAQFTHVLDKLAIASKAGGVYYSLEEGLLARVQGQQGQRFWHSV